MILGYLALIILKAGNYWKMEEEEEEVKVMDVDKKKVMVLGYIT